MGHEIHHDDFKATTSKERILAMVSARAERDGDYHTPITSIWVAFTDRLRFSSSIRMTSCLPRLWKTLQKRQDRQLWLIVH